MSSSEKIGVIRVKHRYCFLDCLPVKKGAMYLGYEIFILLLELEVAL